MKKIFNVFAKQLFGAHYECIGKSALACVILYFSLSLAEIKVEISPLVLFLTATIFTAGVIWQALNSSRNIENLMGIFMLPFRNKSFVFSYVWALSCYTIITKTSLLLAILFAVGNWNILQTTVALLCACNACFIMAVFYSRRGKGRVFTALWITAIFSAIFFVKITSVLLSGIGISLLLSIFFILSTDAYQFYHPVSAAVAIQHHSSNGKVHVYLFRYLMAHKNYLVNTIGLWGIACFLPFIFGQVKELNMLSFGFAILYLNTPICILLSCDPDLEQMLRLLPCQGKSFGANYCLFIFSFNLSASAIYLISWWGINHFMDSWTIVTAIIFSLQSAIFSVLLEWFFPIRKWKIESDLWHHPRKYIVPVAMLVLAVAVSTFPILTFIMLAFVLAESFILLLKIRRL